MFCRRWRLSWLARQSAAAFLIAKTQMQFTAAVHFFQTVRQRCVPRLSQPRTLLAYSPLQTVAAIAVLQAMARELHDRAEAGQAERCCLDAQQLLGVAMNAADIDGAWRAVLQQELAEVERIK
jgi:hypothetical protein